MTKKLTIKKNGAKVKDVATEPKRSLWTDEEINNLAKMVVQKVDIYTIVLNIKRTVNAVRAQIREASLAEPKTLTARRLKFLIKQHTDAAAAVNAKAQSKVKAPANPKDGSKPTKHRQPWTESQNLSLLAMFAGGKSPDEMAKQLSRTIHSVLGQLKALGALSFNKDNGTFFTMPVAYYKVVEPELKVKTADDLAAT
jgi:hypothetical protein